MAKINNKSDKYIIRLPDGMRERIKKAAHANNRNMNADILVHLEAAYPDESIDKQIFDLEMQLEQLRKQKAERASQ